MPAQPKQTIHEERCSCVLMCETLEFLSLCTLQTWKLSSHFCLANRRNLLYDVTRLNAAEIFEAGYRQPEGC